MNAISTGVDLVEVDRFRNLNPRIKERFFRRVFTPQELSDPDQSMQHLAGKFAAKEAAAKALGCGIGIVSWQELEILNDANGRPELNLHGHAEQVAAQSGWSTWSLSISHTRTHALAFVTALINSQEN
ncbi:holo-[acyl-carrier-protein] synthase [bacterium]|nr:holo-[acyl-carrier-protein] synthase [bacterium]